MASDAAKQAIFVKSAPYEGVKIVGPDFNAELSLSELLSSYSSIGFQANSLARAIEIIDKMVSPVVHRSGRSAERDGGGLHLFFLVVATEHYDAPTTAYETLTTL